MRYPFHSLLRYQIIFHPHVMPKGARGYEINVGSHRGHHCTMNSGMSLLWRLITMVLISKSQLPASYNGEDYGYVDKGPWISTECIMISADINHGVWNHRHIDGLFQSLFKLTWKCVTVLHCWPIVIGIQANLQDKINLIQCHMLNTIY